MSRRIMALVALALVTASCGVIGGGATYDVVVFFPRAVSLYEEGSVQVLGLPAGEIHDVEVDGDRVRVVMRMDEGIRLPADVKAAILPQSLIGERRIQLFPAYQVGQPEAADGHVIPIENTIVPTEPDEALAALKDFLDNLNPDGLGRLIDNAATTLDGQGEGLGVALGELSQLVGNLEANDDDIISIAEKFDDFTQTLLTRETQLAEALDDFAIMADVLADERDDIEALIAGLADLSGDGLDLLSEHAVRLRTDVDIVTRLIASVDTNIDAVADLLTANVALIDGFTRSYDPELNAFRLRQNFGPLVEEAFAPLFEEGGVPFPCIPVDTVCPSTTAEALGTGEAVPATIGRPSPVSDIIDLLGSPTTTPSHGVAPQASLWSELLGTFLGVRG